MQQPRRWAARLALLLLLTSLFSALPPSAGQLSGADPAGGDLAPDASGAGMDDIAVYPGGLAPAPEVEMAAGALPGPEAEPASGAVVAPETDDPVATPKPALPPPSNTGAAEPGGRMAVNLAAAGISAFRAAEGVDGSGVTIAVIDSGIDPSHPDLRTTPDGRPKLVDWKDFTGEGRVITDRPVPWGEVYTAPDGRVFTLPAARSAGGTARFGYWDESKVPGLINRDLDRNGFQTDRFGVLLLDPEVPGLFTQVYVDVDNDGDFRDETPLTVFREGGEWARLGRYRSGAAAERQLGFVVADIDPAGGSVQFGFDSLGHGTQVAGVAAAYGESRLVGAAPGAQLMALKVLTSQDNGNWFAVREAIAYAAQRGAQVINVSLGGLAVSASYDTQASAWLSQVAKTYGVLIVLAADNSGPGLSSGTTVGGANELLTVGAYYSPEMWLRDYGYQVAGETVWWRSGMGPRADGAYIPSLVAPGGSPAPSPRWLHPEGYTTAVGTSIAAPHVSGAAALMLQAAGRDGLPRDGSSLKRAMESGARSLAGLEAYEQGSGLLDVPAAYAALGRLRPVPGLTAQMAGGGEGLLARSYIPGSDAFVLVNPTDRAVQVQIASTAPWVTPALRAAVIPAGQSRTVNLTIDPPAAPGVHSAYIIITDPSQEIPSLRIPVTYVRPLITASGSSYQRTDRLSDARYRRYFVEVAPGTSQLSIATRVSTGPDGRPLGAVQLQVFRPDGYLVYRSDEIGYRAQGLSALFQTQDPVAGVWEVVVVALPREGAAGSEAEYQVQVESGSRVAALPLRLPLPANARVEVGLRVTNPGLPFTGRALAYGLTEESLSVPWRVVRQAGRIDEFTLSASVARLRLEIANVLPASAQVHLWLYRYDRERGWHPYWQATGTNRDGLVIELQNVQAGFYHVFVQHDGPVPRDLQYQYRRLVAVEAFGIGARDEVDRRERGARWEVPLTFYTPATPGRYHGYVILLDEETGDSVAWLPLEVSVGLAELKVTPLVSRLQLNQAGTVVLELQDAASGAPVDGVVTVDGRRYRSRQGRVTVAVKPTSTVHTLRVEADLPGYQFYSAEFPLPVQQVWLSHPAGTEPATEHEAWRSRAGWLLR
ncbi:subtilisin family serine protease [Symbiobacterium terraclitae]|uniref:Subtilisin family serine protease n=1 Tax=Symbiobacterium terraclitae TaxID=557451 RepID=A0ABS4JWR1_9FIRM|nr:S8 family serine peptidase [Symbiobacterium terraclitae]MBP2019973.1 subtilisin family serine protease [Symbiobacterium terraclitae]